MRGKTLPTLSLQTRDTPRARNTYTWVISDHKYCEIINVYCSSHHTSGLQLISTNILLANQTKNKRGKIKQKHTNKTFQGHYN